MNSFSIPDVLVWYIGNLNLKVFDYFFPRLRGTEKGNVVANGNLYGEFVCSV